MLIIAGFVILVFVISTSKILYKSFLSPLSIYFFIWIVTFSLYQLRLIRYRESSDLTLYLLFGSFLTFFLGSVTKALQFSKSKDKYKIRSKPSRQSFKEQCIRNEKKILWLIRVFLIISFLGVILLWKNLYSIIGSFSDIFSSGHIIKHEKLGRIVFANYMIAFAYPAAVLSICYLSVVNYKKLICYLPFLCMVLYGLSIFGRFPIVAGILIYVNGYFLVQFHNRRKKAKHYLLLTLLLLLTFIGSNFLLDLRTQSMRNPYSMYASQEVLDKFDKLPSFLGSEKSLLAAYSYFAGPFGAFDATLENGDRYYLGKASFTPFFRLLAKFNLANEQELKKIRQRSRFYIPAPVVMPTYLGSAYLDFGIIGVLVFPYILGFLSSGYYFQFTRRAAFLSLFLSIVLLVFIEFSVLVNIFGQTFMFITLVVTILVGLYLDKQSDRVATGDNCDIQPVASA